MSKLPVLLFASTLLLIAGVTVYQRQSGPASAPAIAAARKQIDVASRQAEYVPQVEARSPSPAEEKLLRSPAAAGHEPAEAASVKVSAAVLERGLAAEKAKNQALLQASQVLAGTPSLTQPAPAGAFTPKFIMQCLLTVIFCPAALFFIISKRFSPGDKNFAYTTIGTILGFWFATGV